MGCLFCAEPPVVPLLIRVESDISIEYDPKIRYSTDENRSNSDDSEHLISVSPT